MSKKENAATAASLRDLKQLRKAIVATLEAKDSLTGDLGGSGTTRSFAEAIASRL